MITIPYQRPLQLSDPYDDFSTTELRAILNCKDSELGWEQLYCIFQSYLPAGTYEECAYFIPFALNFIQGDDDGAPDLIFNFIWWISEYMERLKNDSIYEEIMRAIESLFVDIVKQFILVKKADGTCYYPRKGSHLSSIIQALNENDKFNWLGDAWLLKWLGKIDTYEVAAWRLFLLDCCYTLRKSNVVEEWRKDEQGIAVARDIVSNRVNPLVP